MRYEDASQSGSSNSENPVARDDSDALAAGARGPATGNVISGADTQTGSLGADLGADGARIVSISGSLGSDATFAGGKLAVSGEHGRLSIDAEGNYSYLANKNAPENSRDVFTYKLAAADGRSDSAALTIEIGKSPAVVQANAQQVVPGPDGVVVLPAGVELSDVRVSGRNLVIDLPDGTQMVIVDGAVFVPRLVLGDVEVPATNLAALLIDSEIRPAAGVPQSGGGNFEVPVGPLDPGVDLGDLIPPTELVTLPPEFEEAAFDFDSEPTILIQTPDQPAGVENATASVNENALGARGFEPAGSNSASTAETTTGTILFESVDTPTVITIGGVTVNAVGQVIAGTFGAITITSIADGVIGYSYTLGDNTLGDATQELFTVAITDSDGDVDTATLTISIIDDVPAPVADVDSVREEGPLVADGNVLTGSGGSDANTTDGVADTPGADGIALSGIAFGATVGAIGAPLAGAFGSLVLSTNGNYLYTLNNQSAAVQALGVNEQLTETFTYTITDGDGDARSTTLTITINGSNDRPTIAAGAATVSEEGLAAGNPDSVGLPTDGSNSATATGQLAIADVDGDALTVTLGAPAGSFTSHGQPISWSVSSDGHVLTGAAGGTTVITVTVGNDGAYSIALAGPVDHPNANGEDVLGISVPVSVNDGLVSVGSTLTISVEDDSPLITSFAVGSSILIDETAGASPLSSGAPLVATSAASVISAAVAFGADGPGTATSFGLSLLGDGPVGSSIASGLQTALGDQPITLTLSSTTLITATYGEGAQTAFTIQMNANGTVTVTQFTALEHRVDGPSASDHDDSLNLVNGTQNLVNATATNRDFDGDLVSGTVPIGAAITFEDDGPSVTLLVDVPTDGEGLAALQLTTSDDGTEGNGINSASTSVAFGGVFGSATDGGADGTATTGISYQLDLLVAQGADSGLDSNGAAVFLYNVGGTIIGSTSATAPASASDAGVVFTIGTTTAGVVTLTQYAQVDHASEAQSSGAPFADQLALLGDGLVQLTATASITDNDGDTDSDASSLDLGDFIRFADDGPAISAALVQDATLRIDETDAVAANGGEVDPAGGDLGTVTVAAATLLSVSTTSASADAPTTNTYALSAVTGTASGLLLSTTNTAIVLVAVSATLVEGRVGTTGGALAFSVAIDPASGAVTLTQYLAVEHANTSSADEDSSGLAAGTLGVTITATDFDNDTATATADLGSIIRFEDDGPSIDVTAGSDAAITLATFDAETIGANDSVASSSADFGGAFAIGSSNGGSDGTASVSGLSYALATAGGASGLASGGLAINLYLVGTTVIGSTAASIGAVDASNTIFDVRVDGAGVVTLTQYAQIDHAAEAGANDAPFADQVASLLDGAITLTATATITDNDGDVASDSASLAIGANLTFADDGPAVSIALNQGATIRVDETDGVAANASESDTLADGHLGQAVVGAAGLFTTSFTPGADGASASFALSAVTGTASGLLLSTTNTAIVLVAVSATLVEGRVGTTGGALAFSVAIDPASGAVTLTQYLAVEHANTSSADEDSSGLAAGTLGVTITATDFDNDTATATADLGSIIRFEDDGPSIDVTAGSDAAITLATFDAETIGANDSVASSSADFGGAFAIGSSNGGSDGTASVSGLSYALATAGGASGLASGGLAINLYLVGTTVIGSTAASIGAVDASNTIFDVRVDGAGVVTLTQYAQIDHAAEAGANDAPFADQVASLLDGAITLTATATITDNDGDVASDSASLAIGANLTFADDGPAVSIALNQGATIRVDETDGVAANASESDTLADGHLGQAVVGAAGLFTTSFTPGADGASASFALSAVTGTASGLLLSTTNTAIVLVAVSATLVEGRVGTTGGALAFSVAIDPASGAVTLTQYLAVEHANTSSADEDSSGLAAGTLGVTITATDFDNDTATATADLGSIIRFEDDGPSIDVTAGSDAAITLATFDAETIGANDSVASSSADFGGAFAIGSSNGGSDGTASVSGLSYALATAGGASGLASGGLAINLYLVGTTVIGSTAASIGAVDASNTIFDVRVDGAGVVTLTQYAQIDHAAEAGANDAPFADQVASLLDGAITLTATATITDNDGDVASDSASLAIGANLTFADDGPAVSIALNQGATIRVDETDGVAANASESDTLADGHLGQAVVGAAGLFTTSFTPGADGASASFALSAVTGTASGLLLSTTNTAIVLVAVSATLVEGRVGTTGGALAFSVAIDPASGAVTLTQYLAVEHANTSSADEDSSGLAAGTLGVTITATDFDNDTATATADLGSIIRFEDDGPSIDVTAGSDAAITLATFDAETIGANDSVASSSADFGGAFAIGSSNGGSDGTASVSGLSYALATAGGASGLASGGLAINLYLVGTTVIGSTAASIGAVDASNTIFDVRVDGAGVVTLTQYAQIDHAAEAGANDAPFADQVASLLDGAITLTATATITDNDGDVASDSASLAIGANLTFADDGPAVSIALNQGATIRVDETDGVAANASESDTLADGHLGQAVVGAAGLFTTSFTPGADGASASFALSAVTGTASGLLLSTTNTAIVLVAVSATLVEGRVGTTGGALAFSVAIDPASGAVTLTQYLAVEHANTSSADEDSSGLAAGTLGVTITATDFDNDTATATADLGSIIRFEDDGPSIDVTAGSDAAITLATFDAETIGANDSVASSSADFGGAFAIGSSNGGSDGTASVSGLSYALATAGGASGLASGGLAINLYLVGTTVIGSTAASIGAVDASNTIFDVRVDGAGVVTLTQYAQIDHAAEAGANDAPFADQVASLLDGAITLTATATITDNDGDVASDSASLAIGANLTFADDGPAVSIALNQGATIRVDETDGVAANASESDTLADGHLGQAVVGAAGLFTTSFTPGADGASASFALSAVTGTASGLLLSTTNTAIVLVAVSATLVEGRVGTTGGALAFSVAIDPASGAVTLTQYLAVEHANTSSADEDSSGLAAGTLGVTITATDFDNDTATATADLGSIIRFEDDGPQAIADSATQAVENAPVTIDVFANDVKGADGAVAASVQLVAGSQIGAGTLTNNGDGTFTLVPVAGQTGTVVFQYSFVDGDGDPTQATATITLLPDSAPVAIDVTAKLDDDGLGAGNPASTLGDDNQNLGETGSGTSSEAVWTGTLGVSAGTADAPISYSLAGMTAAVGATVGTETVTYAYSSVSGTGTLTATTVGGSRAGTLLFTVTLNEATGAYAVTLNNAIMHPTLNAAAGDNSENNSSVVLTYRASDSDTPADFDDATITIDFDDDMPSAFTANSVSFINSGTYDNFASPASLNLAGKVGADGLGSLVFVDDNAADNYLRTSSGAIITSGGAKIILSGYGSDTLVGRTEGTNLLVMTVEVNPSTNSYAVNFDRALDDGSGVSLTNLGFATAGNKNFNFIDVAGTTEDLLFSGYNRSAGNAVSIGTVNTNNTAIGVNNQSMNDGDNLRIDFVNSPTVSGSASNTYDFPASPGHYAVNNFSFEIVQVGGNTPANGIEIWVRAYDADNVDPAGTSADHFNELADDPQLAITGIQVNGVNLNLALLTSDGNGGYLITGLDLNDRVTVIRAGGYDRLEIENAVSQTASPDGSLNGDSFDIGKFTFTKINSGTPLEMNFDLALEDADGDRIVVENAITLTSNPVTPVAIDTNHDGSITYLGLDAGVRYDYDGNGSAEATAWVGGGDSLLVRDADGNGTVSGASEFVFGGNGLTDLQALHAQYGAQLDANDADFGKFMVWNDANSNGTADAGELKSLVDAGIVSVDLVSNGIVSSGAGGDVMIAGEGRFTYVNDNGERASGLLADVAFRTADRESDLAQRFAGAANGTGVVTAAVAAMGLAASQAAASTHDVVAPGLITSAASGQAAGHVDVATGAVAAANDVSRSLLGNETREAADDGPAATANGANHAAPVDAKLSDSAQDSHAPTSLLSASEAPVHDSIATSAVAPMIVLPSAEAFLAIEGAESGSQRAVTVEKVLAEALHGGTGGGEIDALLAALPGHGSGENPALAALASPQGEGVSAWDMGAGGHLSAILSTNIVADMTVFHHDAVQPAING